MELTEEARQVASAERGGGRLALALRGSTVEAGGIAYDADSWRAKSYRICHQLVELDSGGVYAIAFKLPAAGHAQALELDAQREETAGRARRT